MPTMYSVGAREQNKQTNKNIHSHLDLKDMVGTAFQISGESSLKWLFAVQTSTNLPNQMFLFRVQSLTWQQVT